MAKPTNNGVLLWIPIFLPLHHIHGIINIMSCALWSGAELEALPRFDLDAILSRVADHAYTLFMAVPTIYVKLIERLEAFVFREYWNRPEATSDSFTDGWFRTGDIAVIEAGYYRIMGRSSVDIIKSGGYQLSALEIEASLLDHPAIAQWAVVGVPDITWGEKVAVAVVLKLNEGLDLDSRRTWCDTRISP